MKNLDFEWLTDEFMLYCCNTQLRKNASNKGVQSSPLLS